MLSINNILLPQILAAEKDFLIVYKPPRLHSAPLARSPGANIFDFCAAEFPEIAELPGRKPGEGGLFHRLDYETQGLMLFARNRPAMEALLAQQKEGKISKEYSALASESKTILPGFPVEKPKPPLLESAFRPYGPGRKATRPVLFEPPQGESQGELYRTEILETQSLSPDVISFRLRILKGFRHQIRCHLAWLGKPILNDSLYGGASHGESLLALRACSLNFSDPSSGEAVAYSIPTLDISLG